MQTSTTLLIPCPALQHKQPTFFSTFFHRHSLPPIPNQCSHSPHRRNLGLHPQGLDNLNRAFDVLEDRFGFAEARRVVLQGGSAGGLSTFLHLDRVADRLASAQRKTTNTRRSVTVSHHNQRSLLPPPKKLKNKVQSGAGGTVVAQQAKSMTTVLVDSESTGSSLVVGRPVAGFFIDEANFDPSQPSYASSVKYGVGMFNSTPALSSSCKSAHPGDEWRCWMAPYVAPFVRSPVFVVQSRFDEFQLACLLGLPCFAHQS